MSPRAACRLETLGFERVFDYMPGKVDWLARGLPRQGANADQPRVIDFARDDVVTCRPGEPVAEVRQRAEASSFGFAFVVGEGGVLLGRLRKPALAAEQTTPVEAVMEPGPSTVRADGDPTALRQRLERQNLTTAVITDPEGRLVGIVRADELPAG